MSSSSVLLVTESCNSRLFKASVEGAVIPHLQGGPSSLLVIRVEPTLYHTFAKYAAGYRVVMPIILLPSHDSPGRQVGVSQSIHKETETVGS